MSATTNMQLPLPYICPDHSAAQIRHEWNRIRSTSRLTGVSWEHNEPDSDQYYCAECHRELAPPKEKKL